MQEHIVFGLVAQVIEGAHVYAQRCMNDDEKVAREDVAYLRQELSKALHMLADVEVAS
jgi:hypothetical protein